MNPLHRLAELGQAVWLDSIRRSYLADGGYLPGLIAADEVRGLTSNPTIFAKAVAGDEYGQQLAELAGADPREALWAIMTADVRRACDLFLPLWRATDGAHGQVSIELDPAKAYDTEATVADGLALAAELDRPNLMVKVPGTEPGLPAITRLLAEGVNVNVTLLFSVARHAAVIDAYAEGMARWLDGGGAPPGPASVASFFVSRVDTKADTVLGEDHPLRGTAAIANARRAYAAFRDAHDRAPLADLLAAGARPQRPLWASTSTKDPAYPDTVYVDALAGPDTVNTMPEATLEATRDHGDPADRLTGAGDAADQALAELAEAGVDLEQITKELEAEGVQAFVDSFDQAVETVAGALD